MVVELACRACRSKRGAVVLDLGNQPACDHFPAADDAGPDPTYPLRMWVCSACALAQLMDDPTVPEEPRGVEPAALVRQARRAVEDLMRAGWLRPGMHAAEFMSPHGSSWRSLLKDVGLRNAVAHEPADAIFDCFAMMHCPDQAAAIAERTSRVAPDGVLIFQYHSLAAMVRHGQWNSVRHGHYAYYSLRALAGMLANVGFTVRRAWQYELFGGTVLVAATRARATTSPHGSVDSVLANEDALALSRPDVVGRLQSTAERKVRDLERWLQQQRDGGLTTFGYGAASKTVALLNKSRASSRVLRAVADASADKQGRRMPGTDIPIVSPSAMVSSKPDRVLLFLPDLLSEVRESTPEIEESGASWVDVEALPA